MSFNVMLIHHVALGYASRSNHKKWKSKTPNTNPDVYQHHEPVERKQNADTEQLNIQAYPSQLNTDIQKDKPNHQKNTKRSTHSR